MSPFASMFLLWDPVHMCMCAFTLQSLHGQFKPRRYGCTFTGCCSCLEQEVFIHDGKRSNGVCGRCSNLNLNLGGLGFFCFWLSHQSCWAHQRWFPVHFVGAGMTVHPKSGLQVSVCFQDNLSADRCKGIITCQQTVKLLNERKWCSRKPAAWK